MMKNMIRILSVISAVLLTLSIGGVWGIWIYADPEKPNYAFFNTTLTMPPPVNWEEKETLPPEHARLVEIFVQEINNPTSEIHSRMTDRLAGFLNINWFGQKDELGSMDEDGAELREIFSCESSHFIVKMNAETNWVWDGLWQGHYENTYYDFDIYTTETDLSTLSLGDWVENVYKTSFKQDENGDWIADVSVLGRAPYSNYDAEWSSELIPAFDVDAWEPLEESEAT